MCVYAHDQMTIFMTHADLSAKLNRRKEGVPSAPHPTEFF